MIIRKHFLIPIFLFCFAFANSQPYAAEKAVFSLTPEEKAWLAEHPEISVGIMDAWAPMNFVDATGTPDGIGVDYLKALNQRLESVQILGISAEDKAIEPSDEELAAIPAELVQDLPQRMRVAAEIGNVSALIALAEELKARSDSCDPLSNRIAQLAEDFDFEGILKLADDLDAC